MRFVATVFLWLVTTVALAAAVPAMWAQKNIVDANGYAAFAQSAAKDPRLQQAMASELTTQIVSLASNKGYDLNPDLVRGVTTAYTQNAGFPWAVRPGEPDRAHLDVHRRDPPPRRHRRPMADRHRPDAVGPVVASDVGQSQSWRAGHADGADHGVRHVGYAARTVTAAVDVGSVGEHRSDGADGSVRAADVGCCAGAGQSTCSAGCFGAAGGRRRLGGPGGGAPATSTRR